MRSRGLLLSCEHGGARIPRRYAHLFRSKDARRALAGHEGSDLGALALARALERATGADLHASTVSRLLVDLNRSRGHPGLFSRFSKRLDPGEREDVLERWYFPHRNAIESSIERQATRGCAVLHVGVHSFAGRVSGRDRKTDVGLLYDPSRRSERALCEAWKRALRSLDPELRVRRNHPYLGKADGLVTHLRSLFTDRQYIGIELEVNQVLLSMPKGRRRVTRTVVDSLRWVLDRK